MPSSSPFPIRENGYDVNLGIERESSVIQLPCSSQSLVVARRVIEAIKIKASKGMVDLKDYPLLMHIDGILNKNHSAELPWDDFTFENFLN